MWGNPNASAGQLIDVGGTQNMLWPPSGRDTWQFGYGDRFDEGALKILPAGSVYSEPGQMNHFARTGDEAVLVEISGFGPTDTKYVSSADAPKTPNR